MTRSSRSAGNGFGPEGELSLVSASVTPVSVPRSVSDIPGLGPIRVRALQKAGLGSLNALRMADLEALLAVPGLTEVKARHILEFLGPFSLDQLESAVPAVTTVQPVAEQETSTEADNRAGTEAVEGASHVVQRATRAMGEVISVLLSPAAPEFRSRFLRILGQFAQCAESLANDAMHLSPEQQARAVRRLRRAAKVLSEFAGASADKKAQGRVAETLEELTIKLADCRLS